MPQTLRLVDQNYNAVGTTVTTKTLTFIGATPNALGDHDGTSDPYTIFTVSGGRVLARVFGICETSMEGASGTMEVGIAGATASIIPQIVATTLLAGEIWSDATPTLKVEAPPAALIIPGNIILTVATANLTAGVITMYCMWEPLTPGARVTAG